MMFMFRTTLPDQYYTLDSP